MLKGAEIFLKCLQAEGVELMFGYPGGAIMPLYDALDGSGIRHVLTRHEQGAVFAAEGHARATGKVGVAIATSGKSVSDNVQSELTKSFSSASDAAKQYPANIQHEIVSAAKTSFLHGDQWAYTAGIVAVLLGATIVFFKFPRHAEEEHLLAAYAAQDAERVVTDEAPGAPQGAPAA